MLIGGLGTDTLDGGEGADVMIGGDLYFASKGFKLVNLKPASAAYVQRCIARPAYKRAWALNQNQTSA